MSWLNFLGPTLAVTVGYLLTARSQRKQARKLDAVHSVVNGQNDALVQVLATKDAKIETLHDQLENGS